MNGYLIYHPKRERLQLMNITVYHAQISEHQDPYVWNNNFLHSYCHITQLSITTKERHVNFWVSGDTSLKDFSKLYCDLVFDVKEKIYWSNSNQINRDEAIVDSDEAYYDHYIWGNKNHPLKSKRRYTLKADPIRSFQPQNGEGELLDILPLLNDIGYSLSDLKSKLKVSVGSRSRPMRLNDEEVTKLYEMISRDAKVKLRGNELMKIRQKSQQLASIYN